MLPIEQRPLQIQSIKNLSDEYAGVNSLFKNNQSNSLSKVMKQTNQDLFRMCKLILKKTPQSRTVTDNKNLVRLTEHNKFLEELVENVSMDCFKNLMKYAKIQEVPEKQLLCDQGKLITHIIVVLEGKLGVCKHEKDDVSLIMQSSNGNEPLQRPTQPTKKPKPPKTSHAYDNDQFHTAQSNQYFKEKQQHKHLMLENIFDGLTQISCKQVEIMRSRNVPLNKKVSLPIGPSRRLGEEEFMKYDLEREADSGEVYGAVERINSKYHPNSCITLQRATIMILDINMLMICLQTAFRVKLNQTVSKLKKIPCFSFLQEQKLAECILCMRKQKRKRNEFLYKQGDRTDKVYILINGEIKLTKEARLFEENPNELYMDRRKIIAKKIEFENDENVEKVGILPYANLTTMYNFRPMKKTIEIGIITSNNVSFSLIGEEQLIEKRPRQTNAMIISFDAELYEIEIKKLEQILGGSLSHFYMLMQKALRKVILYRQNEYANKVINQNKKNLDYFYYQGSKVQGSPRKYRIEKINNKLNGEQEDEKVIEEDKDKQRTKPFYTTFNFEKLVKSEKKPSNKNLRPEPKSQRKSDHLSDSRLYLQTHRPRGTSTSLKKRSSHQDSEQNIQIKYDPMQQRLMSLSHSWKPMKKKVGQQIKVMQKISSKRHTINLLQPLIEQEYFTFVDKQQRRINREHKMFKLSLGKRIK